MRPSVFISRDSHRAQSFIASLGEAVGEITCKSLIDFSLIHSDHVPQEGWLFFYSQSGVDFFLKQRRVDQLLAHQNVAAFGSQTAAYLRSKDIEVSFEGDGSAKTTSAKLLSEHHPERITFVRGARSLHSLKAYLPNDVVVKDMIVYDHAIAKVEELPDYDILVFTSPMNVDAFCKANTIDKNQWAIAIGPTTATALLSHNIEKVIVSKTPSMEGLAEAVLSIVRA